MDPYSNLGPEKLSALGDFLVSLRDAKGGPETLSPRHDAGRRIFEQAGCGDCHSLTPDEAALGPSLAGYGSKKWLTGFLRDPGAPLYYDKDNAMPDFGRTLTAQQIDDLVVFLGTLAVPDEALASRP
jgi:mono/diheme cytochrome c family protein